MHEKGVLLSLTVFVLSTILFTVTYFSSTSLQEGCTCSAADLRAGVCCAEPDFHSDEYENSIICTGRCYCSFLSAEEDPCSDREMRFKDRALLMMYLLGGGVVVSMISLTVFYFEPWYECICLCNDDEDDEDEILGNSVIPRCLSLHTLEERGIMSVKK